MAQIGQTYISHGGGTLGADDGRVSLIFTVFTDNRTMDDQIAVANWPVIPKPGDPYQCGNTLRFDYRAKNASPSYDGNVGDYGGRWKVTVNYERSASEEPPGPSEGDPCTVSMSNERIKIVATRDRSGRLICNSAGQLYDPPVEREIKVPVFSIQRKEYRNPCMNSILFEDCVNSLSFWGFAPWKVLIKAIAPGSTIIPYKGRPVWDVRYEVAIKNDEDGWRTAVLDAGKKQLSTDTKTGYVSLEPILNIDGTEMDEPHPLNGSGRMLPSGSNPHYNIYELHVADDLNVLSLPNPFSL